MCNGLGRMTVRHAFGTEVAQWDASDPGKIVECRCTCSNTVVDPVAAQSVDESVGVGSRQMSTDTDETNRRLPEFVLLVGDKEVEQAHFEDQMRCFGDSLRAGGHTVYTAIVAGKSHSTTIRHLGAVSDASALLSVYAFPVLRLSCVLCQIESSLE